MKESDLTALAVVAVWDEPSADRLTILLRRTEGASVAAELAVAAVEKGEEGNLLEVMEEAVATRPEALNPGEDQLQRVSALIPQVTDKRRASRLLGWVATHDLSRALGVAAAIGEDAPTGAPDPLVTKALTLLGSSSKLDDRRVVTNLAHKCAEANEAQAADAVLAHLKGVTTEDLEALIDLVSLYPPRGWSPLPSLLTLLGTLSTEQLQALVEAVPDRLQEAWFNQHLLPHLFSKHAASIAQSLDADWWPTTSINWLVRQAPWETQEDRLWQELLRRSKRRSDPALATAARSRISTRVSATADQATSAGQMPRLGVHLLLGEALGGDITPDGPELVNALSSIESDLRIAEYRRSRWAQPNRAAIMGAVIAAVDITDLEALISEVFGLRPAARDAVFASTASHLTQDLAERLVEAAGDDERALAQLASSPAGSSAVLAKWHDSAHLPSWRALEESESAQDRLAQVPSAVCDYNNHLTASERRELLEALGSTDNRYQLLLQIVNDRSAHPPPDNATLVKVIELIGDHLADGAATEQAVEALGPICRQHDDLRVRQSAYSALSRAAATDSLVELLRERSGTETARGKPAVAAAIGRVTKHLVALASDPNPQVAITAVTMLDRIQPEAALPDARRIATTAPRAQDRVRAIRIIADHGDRQSDPGLLRTIADDHPDLTVRSEAERAIRRLEIGDLHAAHERLGEMAGLDPTWWNQLDPTRLFGRWGEALREGLDRIATNEGSENWGQAIDQLSEVAKVLLYRALEVAGTAEGISDKLVGGATANTLAFGTALGTQQFLQTWPWVHHFASLYNQRTEHLVAQGSTETSPKKERPDYEYALRLFRGGATLCCALIAQHAP